MYYIFQINIKTEEAKVSPNPTDDIFTDDEDENIKPSILLQNNIAVRINKLFIHLLPISASLIWCMFRVFI